MNKTILELQRAFGILNKHLFNDELDTPIITIQSSGASNTYGWCTEEPVWANNDGELKYEICITGEFLDREPSEICHTLLHEMCHQYNAMQGIKDVSGKSHNKHFKETAEEHGLNCEKAKGIGFGVTSLTKESMNIIEAINFDMDVLEWKRIKKPKEEKEPITLYKYVCPNCNTKFTLKYEIDATCKECNCAFDVEVKNQE